MFNSQKKYFKKKLAGIQATIWDFEFKKFKNRLIREEFRKEYDGLKSKLHILLPRLESEKDKLPVDEFKRLEDQKVILERDIKRQEEKMAELDVEDLGLTLQTKIPMDWLELTTK